MRNLTLALVFILAIIACGTDSKTKDVNQSHASPINIQSDQDSQSKSDKLVGKWISVMEDRNGKVTNLNGIHVLTLNSDGSFASFYKPSNKKEGEWKLINDSTFQLYLKALDPYKIIELTDSTMTAQLMFLKPDTVIIHYKKE